VELGVTVLWALGVAAEFEFTMRQIDVIGEWERVNPVKELARDAIVSNAQVWLPGLRFEDFAGGDLDLETSKTQAKAIFDVTAYPLFQQALSAVPEGQRRGTTNSPSRRYQRHGCDEMSANPRSAHTCAAAYTRPRSSARYRYPV
jgi:hypothetical protein